MKQPVQTEPDQGDPHPPEARRGLAAIRIGSDAAGRLAAAGRAFFQRHWQGALRLRDRFRISEQAYHLLLAGGVGIIGGLVNVAFHHGTEAVTLLFAHQPGDLGEVAEAMAWWQRLIIPAGGGLVAGFGLMWGLRLVGNQGSSNLLEVVVAGDGRLPFRTGLVKTLSSLLSISSGGSIGREGSIIHLSATVASKWGQLAHWHPYRLRLLVACGAASGMAAAYNAPLAGSVFAAQIVLSNFSMILFAPVVFSAVVAAMVSRSFFGIEPLYQVPVFQFTHLGQLPWFVVLGLLSGALGAAFLRLLQLSETLFNRLPPRLCLRMSLAGLGVGALAIAYPWVWGNGYSATSQILRESFELRFLLGLFLAKVLATLLTVGSGAVGGVFTPTLFIGAALGSVLGGLLHAAGCALELPTAVFALAGMGSTLAATTHSPLLAILMVFEISLNYSLMPPLMLACATATLVGRQLHAASVYTEPLRRKGVDVQRESLQWGAAAQDTVGDLMRAPVPPVRETAPLREMADRFLKSSNNFLPVVTVQNRLCGMIALQDLKEELNTGQDIQGVIAYDLMRPPPAFLTPNQRLIDVLPVLLSADLRHIPVVNNAKEQRLVGALVRSEALGLLSEAIAARTLTKT